MTAAVGDVGGMTLVTFPATWLRVYRLDRPMTAREFLAAHPEVTAAADGSMFGFCPGEPHDYRSYNCGVVDYGMFDGVTGALQLPRHPSWGGTLLVRGGRAEATTGCDVSDWWTADVAWQGYPALVRHGDVVHTPGVDPDRVKRVGAGRLRDGRVFLAAATCSMHDFSLRGAAAGAEDFFYADGGGSGVVAARVDGGILADAPGALDSRRVPSFVAAVHPLHWVPYGRMMR